MSTVAPATARDLHAAAAAGWVAYLDAPVSGSTPQAEQGQLVVLVGGDAALFERGKPLLLAMGKSAEHLGGPGAGSTAKLAINAMLAVGVQALAEGLALAERGGLGPQAVPRPDRPDGRRLAGAEVEVRQRRGRHVSRRVRPADGRPRTCA